MSLNPHRGAVFALVASTLFVNVVPPASAQLTVFDPTNYTQNLLQAARALEQGNNQIQSLQNEAQMLQNMAKNLKTLDVSALIKINTDLATINTLMSQAKGIAFSVSQTEASLKQLFPSSYSLAVTTSGLATDAQSRWEAALGAYQQTMTVQSQVDEALNTDAATLSQLLTASEGAEGSLAAQQASTQLLALTAKQQMQIETLMAAQYRADAIDAARKVQGEAAAKAATTKFLGSGTAYKGQ